MITPSQVFQSAYANGNYQRMFFAFANGTIVTNEDIDVSAGVDFNEIFCSETDLTIGLCPSSEISFTLLNDDGYYTDFTYGQFTAYLGVLTGVQTNSSTAKRPAVTISGDTATVTGNRKREIYTIIPMGTFIALKPDIVDKVEIAITANDLMTLFERDMPSKMALGITYPVTASALLNAMCAYLNVTCGVTTFINSGLTLQKEPKNIADKSMREVLSWIAEIACANARFNRAGELVFVWLNPVEKTFDETGYTQFESTWYETGTVDKLHTRNADSTEESVLSTGTGANPYMIQDNPFLRIDDSQT